jgi:hypothetical protein
MKALGLLFALTLFACGQNGADGAPGETGQAGQSVAGVIEPPGANCRYGGIKYTSATGDVYVCDGVPGPTGLPVAARQVQLGSPSSAWSSPRDRTAPPEASPTPP